MTTPPSPTSQVSFRDFAGAIMQGDLAAAARTLEVLLELDAAGATAAAEHFQRQMAAGGPDFMMKAMGLRQVVASGDDAQMQALLAECFGLDEAGARASAQAVRRRFG